jgi:hypothetical protein
MESTTGIRVYQNVLISVQNLQIFNIAVALQSPFYFKKITELLFHKFTTFLNILKYGKEKVNFPRAYHKSVWVEKTYSST